MQISLVKMPGIVVVGAQWGDEGKGKVVDAIAPQVSVVVRYQGGANAGHTVYSGCEAYALHQIPSGVMHAGKKLVLGDGMALNIDKLIAEIYGLKEKGLFKGCLYISDRAHVALMHYFSLEAGREAILHVGTTQQAIGPTYEFAANRAGIRIGDLSDELNLRDKIRRNIDLSRPLLPVGFILNPDEMAEDLLEKFEKIRPYVADTSFLLSRWLAAGEDILFEGSQGTLLSINQGTYPHCTSSHTVSGGVTVGAGVPPQAIKRVIGVIKAYPTRVGEGEFPTELKFPAARKGEEAITDADIAAIKKGGEAAIGKYIRVFGDEYGATTGRPRRPGWTDIVAERFAVRVNGMTEAVPTRLDILDGIDPVKACVAYDFDGRHIDEIKEPFPSSESVLARCRPVYVEFPGWPKDSSFGVTDYGKLHGNARRFLEFREENLGIPFRMISTGPKSYQTIFR